MNEIVNINDTGASPFDAIRRTDERGEYWSARDMQGVMTYSSWQKFETPLHRAMASAKAQGHDVEALFTRSVEKSGGRPREDFRLARFAAYLVAMNGDPNMPEVAAAQAYFAVKTREAEVAQPRELTGPELMAKALLEAADTIKRADAARIEAEQRARALEAPAKAWGHMAASAGDYSVADAAKVLSRDPSIAIGRDRLFRFMALEGWLFRGATGAWKAYQTQIDNSRLAEKLNRPYLNERTGEQVVPEPTIRITPKGLAELHKRLGGTEPVAVAAQSRRLTKKKPPARERRGPDPKKGNQTHV